MPADEGTMRIDWHPWGKEAFTTARQRDRPILLSITATWCHWCHVMDRTSYADPNVVTLVRALFTPVRVDTDRRPDVNRRYNMGGWPTTAFLTPDGEVITGGTYIPPETFKPLLRQVADWYHTRQKRGAPPAAAGAAPETATRAGPLSYRVVERVLVSAEAAFDENYGGFGTEPKFLHPDLLELLLVGYRRLGHERFLKMATRTLQQMRGGKVYDRYMGGFFRYSTTRDWSVPHYEKILQDNARLAVVYLNAFKLTGDECYRKAVAEIAGYVHSTLASPAGGFYGSQDADEEYYSLALPERLKRPGPGVDATMYVDRSALAAQAYLTLSALPELHMLREHAYETIRFLTEKCRAPGGGLFHYFAEGKPQLEGLLADQVHAARLFTAAYRETQETAYLGAATGLVAYMVEKMRDRDSGRFFDRVPDPEAEGRLAHPEVDIDENATTAMLLIELHYLTGIEGYLEMAEATLAAFMGSFARYGILAAGYALVVDSFLNPISVSLLGAPGDETTAALRRTLRETYLPGVFVEEKAPVETQAPESARVHICAGKTCLPPLSAPAEVKEKLLELVRIAGR